MKHEIKHDPAFRALTPKWHHGYRFQYEPAQKAHVVLYPEGMIKLNDSASLIGGLIDGERTIAVIIDELQQQFPNIPELGMDVNDFMKVAKEKYWIDLV
ncbi:pyrroloquinoline quinone biosynthesis peptide chaperone PqqD [Pseudomonas syringae pv. tomato]|uniref:pyrroloquinoline quinone biosynthesis peptide chaperone PqqD n=1 Tax=Pseudomonas syringae group genomosp. 3 TaxID=251701 RepID=UPI002AFE5747|nr:pyrroloquinoline quinone biosynthesis peptide chaperone PqqD [Pseudomonas syringae group genomosp. 3]MEA1764675.1 pyrroloquinoline quinone biosynthesis peptide chaperone PqqD [Pseudomonas syringae pv. tomato]